MKTLTISLVLLTAIYSSQFYAQNLSKNGALLKSAVGSESINVFPDSIYLYSYGDSITVAGRQYYSKSNNVLQVKYFSESILSANSYLYATDLFYYNESDQVDSSILESTAEGEYSEYAIKHIYNYADNLLMCDSVFVDHVDDSINDDCQLSKIIKYSFDNEKRKTEEMTQIWNGTAFVNFMKTSYSYKDTLDGGSIRIDSFLISDNYLSNESIHWLPSSITYNYYNVANICVSTKSWDCSADSGIVAISTVISDMEYNNLGQLISVKRYTPNTQPTFYTVYAYNADGTLKSETPYQIFDGKKEKPYSYEYFYKSNLVNKIEVGNKVIRLYPNPASKKLNIEIFDNGALTCLLYNSNGQVVKSLRLSKGINSFDIGNLQTGIYYIQMPSQAGIITKKLVKE